MDAPRVKVFLNHASEDKPLVRKLYRELKKESWIDPWLDEEEILPGQDWEYEINKALEESDAVIICLSQRSIAKVGVVQAEIRKAQQLQQRRPDGHVFMIPVLLEKCEVPSKLSSLHWVDVSIPRNLSKITKTLESLRKGSPIASTPADRVADKEPAPTSRASESSGGRKPAKPKTEPGSGGFQIGGNVQITNGDLVAGDKTINVGQGGVFAGGDIRDSNIVTGTQVRDSEAAREAYFEELLKRIEQRPNTPVEDREDLKAYLAEIKTEAAKGDQADETFLSRRLRNIKRIAPDIAEVLLATLVNPAAGFAVIVRRIAERARLSADAS